VFVHGGKEGNLFLVSPSGGKATGLRGDGLSQTPAWNSSGTAVVYALFAPSAPQGEPPASGLVLVGLGGNVGAQLTDVTPGVHDVWPASQPEPG
jgi:hypothetical protein